MLSRVPLASCLRSLPAACPSCRLAEKHSLFGGSVPGLLGRHFQLTTADMAAMDEDSSANLHTVAAVLERALEVRGTSKAHRQLVRACRLLLFAMLHIRQGHGMGKSAPAVAAPNL